MFEQVWVDVLDLVMDYNKKEYLISKIISGKTKFQINGTTYYFLNSSLEDKYQANQIYIDKYDEALYLEMLNNDELYYILEELEYWKSDDENLLKKISEDIEDFKVKLFEFVFKSNARQEIRKLLKQAKEKQSELLSRKHHYDHITITGYANSCKLRYLLVNRLHDLTLQKINNSEYLSERLLNIYSNQILSETVIRELARTEPWRTIWVAGNKSASIFNVHPYELNDEQKMLMIWSMTYDNIYQSHECPHDSVIEDDDILDGWMIIQKRKRDKELAKKEGELISGNEKVRNSQEIFVMADTLEDADKINKLNDISGKIMKQKKMNLLNKLGTVSESQMPDSKEKIMLEMARLGRDNVRK